MDYKETVNLPRTEFPMKGGLDKLEPKLLAWWEEQQTYAKLLELNSKGPAFVLHDGPPYANGRLHAGHALNKILKDIVVKYRNLAGQRCDFIPGWDCHGLPIEQQVEKRLREKKIDKRTLSKDEFLEKCREYALEFIEVQREEFKRMGVMGRWTEPYKTLSFDYEAQEIRELAKFAGAGALYRKKKPVYWCVTDHTALAEAEVEYENHTSPSVYVAFPAEGDLGAKWPALKGRAVSFAIWTTTPWTLPANLAIAVHPKLEYVFYDLGEKVIAVAKDLLPKVLAEVSPEQLAVKSVQVAGASFDAAALVDPKRILAFAQGDELVGLQYKHVFYGRVSPVLAGEHVTLEQGTGLVHTAPGHGQDDYVIGLAAGLDVYAPVKNDGTYDETVGAQLTGKKVFDANPVVVEMLSAAGVLLNKQGDTVTHSYPHCWRCHKPIIFRATHQWFISLEATGLRQKSLDQIDNAVTWVPRWGRDRIRGMLETRPDWCISRQRTWGVPIPMAICEGCDEAVVSAELMEKVAAQVEREGAGVWYRTPITEFLPAGYKCKCGKAEFRRETDILDVWFDSACSFSAVAEKRLGQYPVDLYLEGSDQHRGWFHSSLLVGVGTRGAAPYKACLTHGFVVDGNGHKMSKSVGNTVEPEKVIKQYGAEILRLWVSASDYRDDVRLSDTILKGLSEGYRKIRNTLRYAISNLYDFDPAKHAVPDAELHPLDRWAKARLGELATRVRGAYEAYEFHLVYAAVVEFCATDLSAVYFDISKDRLYTSRSDGLKRRSTQTVMYAVLKDLLRLLAPVTSFTAEEVWQFLPGERPPSVFLAGLPAGGAAPEPELMARFEKLFSVRAEAQKLLEAARRDKLIGKSVECKLKVTATGAAKKLLAAHAAELAELFIVSQVELTDAPGALAQPLSLSGQFPGDTVHVEVVKADGLQCQRCWTYSTVVREGGPEVCDRCEAARPWPGEAR
jgi:isoleucyl-tRNA synthetase